MKHFILILAVGLIFPMQSFAAEPVRLIFDTDMGNDVDDALALACIHSLETREACKLLAVTLTKDNDWAGPYVDAINTFYGRPDIPIGVVRKGMTPALGKYLPLAQQRNNGKLRYPRSLKSGKDAPEAVALIRKTLAAQPDASVCIVQVGFSTNCARLLESNGDDASPLTGVELVRKKVKLLSVMAGAFQRIGDNERFKEYNVVKDIANAKLIASKWPTEVVFSGFEIGISIPYPASSILRDFNYVEHHPVAESYHLYNPPPHNRPTWDLTSVLYAVFPDRDYFGISSTGTVTIEDDGFSRFDKEKTGRHRYLTASREQIVRVTEALVQLASQPPLPKK